MKATVESKTERVADRIGHHAPWQCMVTITVGQLQIFICGRGPTEERAERDAERSLEIAIADMEEANAKRRARG